MKKFIKNMLIFISFICFFFGATIFITSYKIDKSEYFQLSKNISFLILGHSHSQYAFNDSLIDKSKNFSQAAELYFYTFIKLKKIVKANKQVKIVFLEFSNNQIAAEMDKWLESEEDILYRVPKYATIMDYESYKYIFFKNPNALIKVFPLIFKNDINTLLSGNKDYINYQDWGGYFHHKKAEVDLLLKARKLIKNNREKITYSNVNLEYLYKIITYCKYNNTKLILVRSPQHPEYPILSNEKVFQKILKNDLKEIPFLDFNKFPLSNQDYVDLQHLNYKGARKFSLFFNDLLKHGLLEKTDKQQFINNEIENLFKNNIN
jgi:hypothetical protein